MSFILIKNIVSSIIRKYVNLICGSLHILGFPYGSDIIFTAYNAENLGSIPGSGRSLREGNGYSL